MGYKVLLADDSITVQKIVKLSLTEEGIEVVAFGNGEQAVQQIETVQPDLIMADVFMPGKDGYEVCEFVKAHPRFKNIPVILLVHAFEPFDPERAKKVCADHQLTKPFQSIRTLVTTVQELLARPQLASDQSVDAAAAQVTPVMEQVAEPALSSIPEMGVALMAPPVPAMSYGVEPELPVSLTVADNFSPEELLPAKNLPETSDSNLWTPPSAPLPVAPSVMSASSESSTEIEDVLDLSENSLLIGSTIQPTIAVAPISSSTAQADDLLLSVMHAEPETNLSTDEAVLIDSSIIENQNLSMDVGLGTLMPFSTIETVSAGVPEQTTEVASVPTSVVAEPVKLTEGEIQIPESVIEDIVNRVIQKLSTNAIQDIAWEVVPEMAELMIRKQIAQQKQLSH